MKINNKGIELIKRFEGCKLKAYRCSAGHLTVGFGHCIRDEVEPPIKEGDSITQEQADAFLKEDVALWESYLNHMMVKYKISLTPNQFSALVSFCFNTGRLTGRVREAFTSNNKRDLPCFMLDYCFVHTKEGAKTLPGLERRRKAEFALFNERLLNGSLCPDTQS